MTSCTRGSSRQTIRLVKDVSVLNVLIGCASRKMEMAAIMSLHNSTIVAISWFYFYLLLYSTLMKTFSDSRHALVTTEIAIMPLLFLVLSVKHAVVGSIGELLDK